MYAIDGDRRIFFEVDGMSTTYRDGALVDKPVLIVVHGGPGFGNYLRPFLHPLAEHASVVTIDLRGSGRSSRHPGSGYPLEGFLDDVRLVQDNLGIERAVLLGHSFGGPVVMEYALANPDRVSGLVLACTITDFEVSELAQQRMAASFASDPSLVEEVTAEMTELLPKALAGDADAWEALDASPTIGRVIATQFARDPLPEWADVAANVNYGAEAFLANSPSSNPSSGMTGWSILERISTIDVPTLVIGADSDAEYATPVADHSVPLAETIPDAELHVVEGAGHYFFAEVTEEFTDPIADFLVRRLTGLRPSPSG